MTIYDNAKYRLSEAAIALGYKRNVSVEKYITDKPNLRCMVKHEMVGKRVMKYITGKELKRLVIAKRGCLDVLEGLNSLKKNKSNSSLTSKTC